MGESKNANDIYNIMTNTDRFPEELAYHLAKSFPKDPWYKRILRKFGLFKINVEKEWEKVDGNLKDGVYLDIGQHSCTRKIK